MAPVGAAGQHSFYSNYYARVAPSVGGSVGEDRAGGLYQLITVINAGQIILFRRGFEEK